MDDGTDMQHATHLQIWFVQDDGSGTPVGRMFQCDQSVELEQALDGLEHIEHAFDCGKLEVRRFADVTVTS